MASVSLKVLDFGGIIFASWRESLSSFFSEEYEIFGYPLLLKIRDRNESLVSENRKINSVSFWNRCKSL